MQFEKNGITITVAEEEIRRLVLERLGRDVSATHIHTPIAGILIPPRIGTEWAGQGGIYAGVVRGRDGAGDSYLIGGPEYPEEIAWNPANSWAKGLKQNGFTDYRLMFRPEGAVCYANIPELFGGKTHWTCEQHAAGSCHVWLQGFDNGGQGRWLKDAKLWARAVRSIPIQ